MGWFMGASQEKRMFLGNFHKIFLIFNDFREIWVGLWVSLWVPLRKNACFGKFWATTPNPFTNPSTNPYLFYQPFCQPLSVLPTPLPTPFCFTNALTNPSTNPYLFYQPFCQPLHQPWLGLILCYAAMKNVTAFPSVFYLGLNPIATSV